MTSNAQDDPRQNGNLPNYPFDELISSGRLLYYPCSGKDTRFPLERFAESIDSFWFVDLRYEKDLRRPISEFDVPCHSGYEVESRTKMKVYPEIRDPFVALRCQLKHSQSGRRLEVLYLSTDAVGVFQCLEKFQKRISVFCHRRDGISEGGSNLWWLHPDPAPEGAPAFLERVLAQVEDRGTIVSDGSNALPEFGTSQNNGPTNFSGPKEIVFNRFRLRSEGPFDQQCTRTISWVVASIAETKNRS